jgi:hypothetical protein
VGPRPRLSLGIPKESYISPPITGETPWDDKCAFPCTTKSVEDMILHRFGGNLNDFKDSQDYHKCSVQKQVVRDREDSSLGNFLSFINHLKGGFVPMESKPFYPSQPISVTLDGAEDDVILTIPPDPKLSRGQFRAPNEHWNPHTKICIDKWYKYEENRRYLLFSYRYFHVMWKYYFISKHAYARALNISIRQLKRQYPGRVNRDLHGLKMEKVYIPYEDLDPNLPKQYSMRKMFRKFPTGYTIPGKEISYFNFLVNSGAASSIDDYDFRKKKTIESIRKCRFPPAGGPPPGRRRNAAPLASFEEIYMDYMKSMNNRYGDSVPMSFFQDSMFD